MLPNAQRRGACCTSCRRGILLLIARSLPQTWLSTGPSASLSCWCAAAVAHRAASLSSIIPDSFVRARLRLTLCRLLARWQTMGMWTPACCAALAAACSAAMAAPQHTTCAASGKGPSPFLTASGSAPSAPLVAEVRRLRLAGSSELESQDSFLYKAAAAAALPQIVMVASAEALSVVGCRRSSWAAGTRVGPQPQPAAALGGLQPVVPLCAARICRGWGRSLGAVAVRATVLCIRCWPRML